MVESDYAGDLLFPISWDKSRVRAGTGLDQPSRKNPNNITMMPRIFYLLVDLTFYFLVYCNGQSARFDMTLLDRGPLRAESDASDNNEYQCYLGNPDTSKDSMKSYRVGWTRDIATENPEPGDMEFTDQGNKWSVDLDVSNNNAFGVFGCNATRDGEWDRTEISIVRMVSNADVVPTVPLYTQTVNVGDLDIIIRMEIRNGKDVANLRWIHNNKIITAADGKDTYVFNDPIEEKDAGIYECYIDGERNLAKHGIHLLIVRACPANRWGPPDCFGVCDICYNGGVCDDYNGKLCGYNRFGHDCGFQCSWIEDEAIKCKSNLFCRPHPLGCTCITGFEGLDCMEDCSTGTYGASCLQTCHCESGECDQFTGSCILSSCEFGWSGINCQVPHICPVDYFGGDCTFKCRCKDSCDKLSGACSTADCDAGYKIYDGSSICTECQGQTFGENCAENCHCYESYCNKVTGSCNGGCDNEWVDLFPPNNCQTGLVDATFTKVNPGVAVPVHCTAIEGPGGDLDTLDLVLSWHPIGLQNEDIKYNGTMEDTNVKINTFIVDNVLEGHWLFCQLRARGTMVAVLDVTIEFYALPCDHQAPAGEMVERDPQGSGPFQDGTIVVYTCPDGYNLVGDTTAVCQNGKWTVEEEPTCEVDRTVRRCVVAHLTSDPESALEYTVRFMDHGIANNTQLWAKDPYGMKYGPFSGGILNTFSYRAPAYFINIFKRPSLEFLSEEDVYLYLSIQDNNQILCYPTEHIGTDYILVTFTHNTTTFLITASVSNTEVAILFNENYYFNGKTYSLNYPLRFTLNDLETAVVQTPFDATGTFVKSSNPVAVMMDLRSNEPPASSSSLFYLPPVSEWGYNFSFTISPDNLFSFRIIAAYDATVIKMDPSMQLCGQVVETFILEAWEIRDFNDFMNCFIFVSSSKPTIVLLNEYSSPTSCHNIVVPSTDRAIQRIPVFIKEKIMQPNIRVWISNEDYHSILIDNETKVWDVVQNSSRGFVMVEKLVEPGYHVISSSNAASRILAIANKELYAAHNFNSEIFLRTCPFEILSYSGVQLTFRSTFPGTSANSTQSCSRDSSYAKQPLSGRFCGHHGWEEPVLTKCYSSKDATDEIERIANTTVTEENVEEVAGDLALITTQTDDLDASEIEDVARSLEDIANANSSSPEVTQSVLGTVNNLMEVDEDELGKETQGSSSVIISLEQQVSNVQENPGNFTDVQVNVGVQAVKVNPSITNAITFISLSPTNNTHQDVQNADLSEENTILHNDEREIQTDNSLTSIFVPSIILEQALIVDPNISYVPISFIIYKDSRLFQTNMASNDTYRQAIASQVISATLEVDKVVIENLTDDDRIISRFMITPQLEGIDSNEVVIEKTCVFWLVQPGSKSGIWSDDGCLTSTDNNHTVCMCSHLTSFAVLVGIETDNPTLNVITWIGSSLSIAGLVASALTLSLIKELRQKHSSQININLCVSLMAFYITFLAGDLAKTSPRHCRNIATAIHYFCLATVGWMTVEAVHMYLLFLKFQSQKAFQLKFKYFVPVSAALVYGLSLVPVLVAFFKSSDQSMEYCFLPTGKGLYFGLLVEILIMVVFNIGVFILLLRKLFSVL
ncbi:putative tyrosine-protein kinase [Apostichopus japonicus]|uniref:Putative tyrosine-protein kinase n=1 Tax=Stichopus japonicus TaxID=307972 RepID=A0A2G8JZK3_STIJA|nr:putative tyrosine-protein kinase [Apostichopus japonicus]